VKGALRNPERDEVIVKAAAEAAVLLKNDGHVLPLNRKSKAVVIGYHAAVPTVGGGGSAKVLLPKKLPCPQMQINSRCHPTQRNWLY